MGREKRVAGEELRVRPRRLGAQSSELDKQLAERVASSSRAPRVRHSEAPMH